MAANPNELNERLRAEKAWIEVAGGLGKVLWGYGALLLGWSLAAALLCAAFAPVFNNKSMKIEHVWYFYLGGAVLKVAGLASWGLVIAGQFRCLMNSPERGGARWIIFFCLTCVVMGPVLHLLAWFAGLSTPIRWTGGPQALQGMKLKFTMMGVYLMSASLITSGLYKLSFWYYLQAIAGCVGAGKTRAFVWLFFVVTLGMAGATYWWLFTGLHPNRVRELAIWIAAGWGVICVYWVVMIVAVKIAIEGAMASVFNPMKDPLRAQLQLAGS